MINIKIHKILWYILIIILIIILVKIIPFYNNSFDQTLKEETKIIISSKRDLSISDWLIIIDWQNKKNIKITNGLNYFPLNLERGQKISFAAKEIYQDIHFFIQYSGNILKIYPQSAIYINNTWITTNIIIIWWIVQYLNTNSSNRIIFEWNNKPFKLNTNDYILQNILQDQKNKQKENIIRAYWWNIILNKTFDYIIYNILTILTKISPKNYNDNLKNYNDFKNYISNLNGNLNLSNNLDFKKNEKNNINKDMSKQFNKWLSKILNSF